MPAGGCPDFGGSACYREARRKNAGKVPVVCWEATGRGRPRRRGMALDFNARLGLE